MNDKLNASKIYVTMALSNNAPILYNIVQGEQLLQINYKKTLPYYSKLLQSYVQSQIEDCF